MKTVYLVLGLLVLASCKDRNILCVDIGNSVKEWTVYDPSDTIRMTDQYGNDTSFIITQYYNKPSYSMKESGGLMKKKAVCTGELRMADPSFFNIEVSSGSSSNASVQAPDQFSFTLVVKDAITVFNVSKAGMQYTPFSSDGSMTLQTNYTLENNTYEEAFVYSSDTLLHPDINLYRFVYAKNKGFIEFSTRMPQRHWKISQ